MTPLAMMVIGTAVRWAATVVGASAVATSDAAKGADTAAIIAALPADKQALAGAVITVATFVWSWWQKSRTNQKMVEREVPVEERTIG